MSQKTILGKYRLHYAISNKSAENRTHDAINGYSA